MQGRNSSRSVHPAVLAYRWPFSSARLDELFTHLTISERAWLLQRVTVSEQSND